jgi:hypothetical protein
MKDIFKASIYKRLSKDDANSVIKEIVLAYNPAIVDTSFEYFCAENNYKALIVVINESFPEYIDILNKYLLLK